MPRSRALAVVVLIVFAVIGVAVPVMAESWAFRFVVIGDTRHAVTTPKSYEASPVFLRNIDQINLLSPDFVVNVGDLITGYTNNVNLGKMWDEYDKSIRGFRMTYYQAVGNHDVFNQASEDLYKQRYGPLYYSFDYAGSHFIVLDSEMVGDVGRISGAQLDWLKQDLDASSAASHIFVFVHKPLWSEKSGKKEWTPEFWVTDVHPLLVKYSVDAVFAGHMHKFRAETLDGIRYVITGGGGAEVDGKAKNGNFHHYSMVTVRPQEFTIAVIKTDGVLNPESFSPLPGKYTGKNR